MNYREIKCSERLPDEGRRYLTNVGWMRYNAKAKMFGIYVKYDGFMPTEVVEWWMEPYDPEEEARERYERAVDFWNNKVVPKIPNKKPIIGGPPPYGIQEAIRIAAGITKSQTKG